MYVLFLSLYPFIYFSFTFTLLPCISLHLTETPMMGFKQPVENLENNMKYTCININIQSRPGLTVIIPRVVTVLLTSHNVFRFPA